MLTHSAEHVHFVTNHTTNVIKLTFSDDETTLCFRLVLLPKHLSATYLDNLILIQLHQFNIFQPA